MDLLLNAKQVAQLFGISYNSDQNRKLFEEIGLRPVNKRAENAHRFFARYDLVQVQQAVEKYKAVQIKAKEQADKRAEKRRIAEAKAEERKNRKQSVHRSDLQEFTAVVMNLAQEISVLKGIMTQIAADVKEVHSIWTEKGA